MIPATLVALVVFGEVATPAHVPQALRVAPFVHQGFAIHVSNQVETGGLGGGLGVELDWRDRYLAAADVSMLWGLGNTVATRVAFGMHLRGRWAPAAWLAGSVLFGDRLELLAEDGRRAAIPRWAIGVRASPLRFVVGQAVVSALEPGVGTDFGGALSLDLTLLRAGAGW